MIEYDDYVENEGEPIFGDEGLKELDPQMVRPIKGEYFIIRRTLSGFAKQAKSNKKRNTSCTPNRPSEESFAI